MSFWLQMCLFCCSPITQLWYLMLASSTHVWQLTTVCPWDTLVHFSLAHVYTLSGKGGKLGKDCAPWPSVREKKACFITKNRFRTVQGHLLKLYSIFTIIRNFAKNKDLQIRLQTPDSIFFFFFFFSFVDLLRWKRVFINQGLLGSNPEQAHIDCSQIRLDVLISGYKVAKGTFHLCHLREVTLSW